MEKRIWALIIFTLFIFSPFTQMYVSGQNDLSGIEIEIKYPELAIHNEPFQIEVILSITSPLTIPHEIIVTLSVNGTQIGTIDIYGLTQSSSKKGSYVWYPSSNFTTGTYQLRANLSPSDAILGKEFRIVDRNRPILFLDCGTNYGIDRMGVEEKIRIACNINNSGNVTAKDIKIILIDNKGKVHGKTTVASLPLDTGMEVSITVSTDKNIRLNGIATTKYDGENINATTPEQVNIRGLYVDNSWAYYILFMKFGIPSLIIIVIIVIIIMIIWRRRKRKNENYRYRLL